MPIVELVTLFPGSQLDACARVFFSYFTNSIGFSVSRTATHPQESETCSLANSHHQIQLFIQQCSAVYRRLPTPTLRTTSWLLERPPRPVITSIQIAVPITRITTAIWPHPNRPTLPSGKFHNFSLFYRLVVTNRLISGGCSSSSYYSSGSTGGNSGPVGSPLLYYDGPQNNHHWMNQGNVKELVFFNGVVKTTYLILRWLIRSERNLDGSPPIATEPTTFVDLRRSDDESLQQRPFHSDIAEEQQQQQQHGNYSPSALRRHLRRLRSSGGGSSSSRRSRCGRRRMAQRPILAGFRL